jgi:hypothetical protein
MMLRTLDPSLIGDTVFAFILGLLGERYPCLGHIEKRQLARRIRNIPGNPYAMRRVQPVQRANFFGRHLHPPFKFAL